MYLHTELVNTWSDQCFSVAVYLYITKNNIPCCLVLLEGVVERPLDQVHGCESAVCNSNQQGEMLRRENCLCRKRGQ